MHRLHIALFLSLLVAPLSAQDNFLKDYAPIPPNPASLGKYGDIPVSHYTGVPDISIPICTLTEGNISLPITLSYHASGIRVEEVASWVGLGWALNAGGVITRSIQHSPDEGGDINQITGYYRDFGHPLNFNSTVCDTFSAAAQGFFDTEPDLFSFNINGYTGKFFFDKNRVLRLIPMQDLKIEPIVEEAYGVVISFKGWIITDPQGIRYHFGATHVSMNAPDFIEYSSHLNLADPSNGSSEVPSSWYLSKIESPDRKDVINLSYAIEKYGFFTPGSKTFFGPATDCPSSDVNPINPIKTSVNGRRLIGISSNNGSLAFIGDVNPREDLSIYGHCPYCTNPNNEAKSLKTIEIRDKSNTCLRKFDFAYSYIIASAGSFPSASIPLDNVDRKRLILNSVTESECATTANSKTHTFEYYDLNLLPRRCALSVDHWGYNNGKANSTLMPGYPYTQTYLNGNCFFVNYNSTCGLLPNSLADREPAFPEMRHGTLKKITYPTGGYSSFEFESHDARSFVETCSEALIDIWNAVPSNCIDPSSSYRTYSFSQYQIDNGNIKLEINLNPGCFNGYVELEIFAGSNPWGTSIAYVVLQVPVGSNYASQSYELTNIGGPGLLPNSNYTFVTTAMGGISATTIWTMSRSQGEVNKMTGGLRIKKITTADGLTSNNITKNFDYRSFSDTTKTSGKLLHMPIYVKNFIPALVKVNASPGIGCYEDGIPFECNQIQHVVFSSTGLNPMYSGQGSHIGYTNITVSESGNGKSRYTYEVEDPLSYPSSYPFIQRPFNPQFGQMLKEEHYNNSNHKIFEKTNAYVVGGDLFSIGEDAIKLAYVPLGNQLCQGGSHQFEYIIPYTLVPLISRYSLLTSTIERTYNVGTTNFVEKSITFSYSAPNGHLQKTIEDVTNSDGTVYRTKYKYAFDYPCPSGTNCDESNGVNAEAKAIYAMRKRHMIAISIEQTTWLKRPGWGSHRLTSATYFQFDKVNTSYDNLKLKTVQQVRPATPLTTFTESGIASGSFSKSSSYATEYNFVFSDVHGNLLSQWKQNDPAKEQYIWGHKQKLPVAKVVNAEPNEIAYASFEEPGIYDGTATGKWVITPNNIAGWSHSANNFYTGRTGFHLTPARTCSIAGLPAGKYIVSFWHRDGRATVNGATVSTATSTTWKYAETELTFTAGSNTVSVTGLDWNHWVDELRLYPADAVMRSFSYDDRSLLPLSIADENSVPAHFDYDNFQRLQAVRDQDRNILQTYEYNYRPGGGVTNDIKARTVLISGQTTLSQVNALTGADVRRVFQYFDGLGRSIQSSEVGQSPTSKDIVTYQQYDQYGREPKQYIPYTATSNSGAYRTDVATAQATFASTWGSGGYGYAETVFEASPLNRVKEQAAPGTTWRIGLGRTMEMIYRGNTSAEAVRDFTNNNSFSDNKLFVNEETDENERKKYTYTDKLGRVVMVKQQIANTPTVEDDHWARTYTIYDDFGRVVAVIPPEAAKKMKTSGSWDWTLSTYASMIYKYVYDSRGRMTSKTVPSGGTTSIAYDRLDRPVLTTDANGFKIFTRYDILSRPVVSGRYKGAASPGASDPLYVSPNTNAPTHYYSNNAFPTDNNIHVYKVIYYDDYDIDNNGGALGSNETYINPNESGYEVTAFLRTKGKTAATKTVILRQDTIVPTNFLTTRTYYDKEYSPIQINKQNHLGGSDIISNAYDFANRLTKTRRDHTATPPGGTLKTYTIREEYVYDHASRLRFARHKINTNNWVVTSAPLYDELDRLADKRLHASNYDGTSAVTLSSNFNYLQSLDYTYNIRGWLTRINNVANCSAQLYDQLPDLFSLQLSYDSIVNSGTPQYNGNISSIQWRTYINSTCLAQQQYRFTYDGANRLTTAEHYTNNSGSWTFTNNYTESGITYDLNGNILSYTRRGLTSGTSTFGVIDQLTYTFGDVARPDRLTKVVDAGSATKGFKYLPNLLGNHYFYDNNGNLTQDRHKNLNFDYNYLNLPDSIFITGSSYISITYTADGEKLTKTSPAGTRNYVAGIEYLGANLEAIYHAEGRCTPNGATAFHYEYTLKDHLGNARVNFRANGTTVTFLEEMHYYPFGMLMEGIGTAAVTVNKYKYNGKERNEDLGLNWYDYGARWYDAALGRWWSVDPLGEIAPGWTPYRYGFDNPILFFDQFGAFETKKEAKEYAKQHGIKTGWFRDNKIVKNEDGTYSIDNKKEGTSTYYEPAFGKVGTATVIQERGIHLRDIGIDGYNDLSNPYSENYNPNAVVFTDGLDIAYAIGSYLSLASPTGRTVKAGQAVVNTAKEVAVKSKTVLGHIEDGYIEVAKKLGANYFNPQKWSKAANQEFLDQVIARGDDVILTRPISLIQEGRVLEWEVQYLLKNGYKELNPTTLVKQ